MGGWNKGQRLGVLKKCECCGKEFYAYPYRGDTAKYCSGACYHEASKKRDVRVCKNCGGVMTSRKAKSFCSKDCACEYRRKQPRTSTVGKDGYRHVWFSDGSEEKEHRYLMEQKLGRTLTSDEVVHHIDGNRSNNDLSNLVVMSRGEHSKLHRMQELAVGKVLFGADK